MDDVQVDANSDFLLGDDFDEMLEILEKNDEIDEAAVDFTVNVS